MQTDGPLFRGRFKSILVSKDSYLLNLSRYIHRNPTAFVNDLSFYKWSSYPAYLELVECQPWLNKHETLEILSMEKNPVAYQDFVENVEMETGVVPGTFNGAWHLSQKK